MTTVALGTLCLNEMEHLSRLYEQHKDWPHMTRWAFIESADQMYAEANPELVKDGLSVDGTTEFLEKLAKEDDRVVHIKYGQSIHTDPAQGKCVARTAYLRQADEVRPDFVFVLDADEFYCKDSQGEILEWMNSTSNSGFCFGQRQIWRPPSIADEPLLQYEVIGGYWAIPHVRGWKWRPGLVYQSDHNSPEFSGKLLNEQFARFDQTHIAPQCIHLGFASSQQNRVAKHRYYAARGEGSADHRGWYVRSRTAFETWSPGDKLPRDARVVKYCGPVPECFVE